MARRLMVESSGLTLALRKEHTTRPQGNTWVGKQGEAGLGIGILAAIDTDQDLVIDTVAVVMAVIPETITAAAARVIDVEDKYHILGFSKKISLFLSSHNLFAHLSV